MPPPAEPLPTVASTPEPIPVAPILSVYERETVIPPESRPEPEPAPEPWVEPLHLPEADSNPISEPSPSSFGSPRAVVSARFATSVPSVPMDNGLSRSAALIVSTVALAAIGIATVIAIHSNSNVRRTKPLSQAPHVLASTEVPHMVVVTPSRSASGTSKVAAAATHPVRSREPRERAANVPPSLLSAIAPVDGGSATNDPQLLHALEELNTGHWPADRWTRRKAMIIVIHALRSDLPASWPGAGLSDDAVKETFIASLKVRRLSNLANTLLGTPLPAPSAIP